MPPNLVLQRTPATGRAHSISNVGGPWPGPLSFYVRRLGGMLRTNLKARHP